MFRALMRTQGDFAMFLVRLGLALSIFPHGAEKVGLLGEGTLDDSVKALAGITGFGEWTSYLAIAAEFLGAIALFFGFFGRIAALGIGITMAVAAWKTGLGDPITADTLEAWWRSLAGGYHLLAIGAALAILARGSGAMSIDRSLSKP